MSGEQLRTRVERVRVWCESEIEGAGHRTDSALERIVDLCDVLLESWAGGGAVGSEPVEQDVRPELHEPATVPPSECNDYDLVELVEQLYTRSFLHNESRDLHDAWVDARNELLRRLGERLGRLPAPPAPPPSPERGLRNSDQPFYLIELPHHCNHDDRPRWMRLGAWADESGDSWTDDVHEATPWPTRSAADVYRERGGFGIDLSNAVVTEHAWLPSPPAPSGRWD